MENAVFHFDVQVGFGIRVVRVTKEFLIIGFVGGKIVSGDVIVGIFLGGSGRIMPDPVELLAEVPDGQVLKPELAFSVEVFDVNTMATPLIVNV